MLFLGEPERVLKDKKSTEVLRDYIAFFEKLKKTLQEKSGKK